MKINFSKIEANGKKRFLIEVHTSAPVFAEMVEWIANTDVPVNGLFIYLVHTFHNPETKFTDTLFFLNEDDLLNFYVRWYEEANLNVRIYEIEG